MVVCIVRCSRSAVRVLQMAREAAEINECEAIGRTVVVEPTTSPICQRRQRGSGGTCAR